MAERIYLKAECETIKHDDGRGQDVIVRAPLLSVKDKVSEAAWEEIKKKVCAKQFRELKEKIDTEAAAEDDPDKKKEILAQWDQFVADQTDETLKMDKRIQVRGKRVADARDRIANVCQKYGIHLEGLAAMNDIEDVERSKPE